MEKPRAAPWLSASVTASGALTSWPSSSLLLPGPHLEAPLHPLDAVPLAPGQRKPRKGPVASGCPGPVSAPRCCLEVPSRYLCCIKRCSLALPLPPTHHWLLGKTSIPISTLSLNLPGTRDLCHCYVYLPADVLGP